MMYQELQSQVIELIWSKSLREAIANEKTVFKPLELVKIIEDHAHSFAQRIEMFKALQKCIDEREVIALVERLIEYHLRSRDAFLSEDNGCIYELHIKEKPNDYLERYVCSSYSAAMRLIPMFFTEYECTPSKEAYYEIQKRKIIGENDLFFEDFVASCYLNEHLEPLEYVAHGIVRDNCDNRCFECDRICLFNMEIAYPTFLDDLEFVRYVQGKEESYGVHLKNITNDDTIYILDLRSHVMMYKDFENSFYAHDHIDPPLVDKVAPQDMPDVIRDVYDAYVLYHRDHVLKEDAPCNER